MPFDVIAHPRAFSAALHFRKVANRLRWDAEDESHPLLQGGQRMPVPGVDRATDLLRDGIYELRASLQGVHYRILYFFHGAIAAVVAHGIVKESAVPPKEIDRAIQRKKRFEVNPAKHRQEERTK
jgi:phage-related protein